MIFRGSRLQPSSGNEEMLNDHHWIHRALELAKCAQQEKEVPVGALLVKDDVVVSEGWNQPIATQDPCAHAEIQAIRTAAQQVGNYRLLGMTLYVTLEPCVMCLGAMIHARIERLVFGAYDPKGGAVGSIFKLLDSNYLNHKIAWKGGIMAEKCGLILTNFFKDKR